jgi:hypothetical protein
MIGGMDTERRLLRRAARQHGLVTRGQALAAGLTADQVDHRLASGRWVALRRGVYVVAGTPSTYEQQVLAACLAVGPPCVASHRTAGRLHGLQLPPPERIDLTVLGDRQTRRPGVRLHRSRHLPRADLAVRAHVPVTSVARTLVDVGGDGLGPVVDDVLRRGLTTLAELRRCLDRLGRGGRRTAALARVLAERGPGHDPGGSDREAQVARALVAAGLPAPVQQHMVVVAGRTFHLDVAYPEARVAVEFDGWDAHRGFEAFHGDRERARLLVAAGWRLLHVTARTTPADLVRDVRALLLRRAG